MRAHIVCGGLSALLLCVVAPAAVPAAAPFAFQEGLNLNSFVRSGDVAAHVVLRSGDHPRVIVAFPAGNSGVGLWFDGVRGAPAWTMPAPARPVSERDARGRPLNGVTFRADIAAARLVPKQAVLSSIRVLRDYQALGTAPAEVLTDPMTGADTIRWSRDRLDGAAGYRLVVKILHGRIVGGAIEAAADGRIGLEITALTGETPLTPLAEADLLGPAANADPAARRALAFLSYREKFLAGSWRFDTYFGRDTLMSVRLLMPALQPAAVETGLRSVLERLSPTGQVAHEEDIGEFAILDHRKRGEPTSAKPVYDYRMIDGDFLLAPVARAWLLDDPRGRQRAAAFLRESGAGTALVRNLRFVATRTAAFAGAPVAANLIGLKPGMDAGEWRDSNDGLGGGRYPYDVNAILAPAALDAAAALYEAGLLAPYVSPADRPVFAGLAARAAAWRAQAAPMFAVTIPADQARQAVAAYAAKAGVPAADALRALNGQPVRFNAIALDAAGRPIPIEHSDEGFALLFGRPDAAALDTAAATLRRPFPAGLLTGAGLLVANPVFANPALQAKFGPDAYHGTVIWSWHQALAAAGLARQLARNDLAPETRTALRTTQACLWRAIAATRSVQSSELWSWRFDAGRYRIAPFGASGQDADESNAAQLWSTVYLALRAPAADPTADCPGT
ncbi:MULTISPECIES: hypothetical protein [unclassified Sphingomonas]|uniref:hypothetical protein n=1 Tax=unclassified Sphingomonas TaxID=196159 RepID=UPI00226A4B3E|nr:MULTISPECIES: hypothetical protein [unclassified Sphingomonas]